MSIILKVKNLTVTFPVGGKEVPAVDGIDFSLHQGKVMGLVGESGCGKTLSALSLLQLVEEPGKIAAGEAWYFGNMSELSESPTTESLLTESETTPIPNDKTPNELAFTPRYTGNIPEAEDFTASLFTKEEEPQGGVDLLQLEEEKIRSIRGNKIAMIFQEPMTSLNPVFTVGDQVMEAITLHQKVSPQEAQEIAVEMFRKVKIPDPAKRLKDYPHQMSGGMRQRVMIAMALSCQPDILIADEPTTALDVTIQAQILELIQELIAEMHMSVLLITHDLGVVAQVCDEVMVMYAGTVVEHAPVARLFRQPKHPYTIGLLESIPKLFDDQAEKLHTIAGTVPPLSQLPSGCRFAARCPRALPACSAQLPKFKYVGEGQSLRCLNY